ncbi:hypothetical protein CW304_22135 [Bacillus sp. UFRGS-B20]|nr:hypothetical protein CW304_22135 [Bacillus sp. UFRGS-B20]
MPYKGKEQGSGNELKLISAKEQRLASNMDQVVHTVLIMQKSNIIYKQANVCFKNYLTLLDKIKKQH